jgi:hypothetical protein
MEYGELNFLTEFILVGVVVVVATALLIRAAVFFRLERSGIVPSYPNSWNLTQCRALERIRLLIGLLLVPLWVVFLFVIPPMATNWSFGILEAISLISMLSVSYAWALLLAARDWKWLDAFPHSFLLTITFLAFWWGTAFTTIGVIFAEASAPRSFQVFGVYAEREMPRLIRTTGLAAFFPDGRNYPMQQRDPDSDTSLGYTRVRLTHQA